MQRRGMALRSCRWFLFFGGLLYGVWADGLVNEEVKRTLDLSTHLAKISAEILLANHGDSAAHSFILALEPELAPHLAYIGASVSSEIYRGKAGTLQPVQSETTAVSQMYFYYTLGPLLRARIVFYLPYPCREHEYIWNSAEVISLAC